MPRNLLFGGLALVAVAACTPVTKNPSGLQRSQFFSEVMICQAVGAWNIALEPIEPPLPIRCAGPWYPTELRLARRQGHSTVRVWINPDGVPDSATMSFVEVSAPEIELAVREAVANIRFAPLESGDRFLVEFRHQFTLAPRGSNFRD